MASSFRIKDDPDADVLHASSSEESSDDAELISDEKSSSYEYETISNSSDSDDSQPKAKKRRALIPPVGSPPQPVSTQPPTPPAQDTKLDYLHYLLTLPSHFSFPSPQPLVPPSQPDVNYVAPSGDVWLSVAPPLNSLPTANVLTQAQGPCHLDGASTLLDLWNLFLPVAILDMILIRTNEEGERKRGNAWSQVVMPELYAAFGLLYHLGLCKSSHEKVRAFWRKGPFARPVCQAAMSGERFQDILTMMQFDDRATRYIRKRHDKFTAIREVTESFASSCRRYYSPGENVTVNEQMVPFRGCCSFKQYMPKKQSKHTNYGLKFSLCVDSKSKYVCNIQPNIGKTGEGSETQLGLHVVKDLVAHMYGTGRNVTTDSFFSSKDLAEHLLSKKMTLVSTIKANRKEVPKNFRPKDDKSRAVKSSLFGFNGQLTLVSHVPKKHRSVLLLSTKQPSNSLDPNTQKPEIVKYYNSTKAGVDAVEQICNLYTVSRITKRWPMAVFYYILNLAAINTYALWTELNPDWSTDLDKRGKFLADLSMALLDEQLQRRAGNAFGLHRYSRLALGMLGYDVACKQQHKQEPGMQQGKLHGRCRICPRKGGKTTTKVCHYCKRFTCALHSNTATKVFCEDCACKLVDGVD